MSGKVQGSSACHGFNYDTSPQFKSDHFPFLYFKKSLTGEGELSQGYVTVQTVIDETDADTFSLHFHPGQRSRVAARARVSPGSGMARYVLSVLQQPRGSLV